jgi:hypothetical protein
MKNFSPTENDIMANPQLPNTIENKQDVSNSM